MSTQNTLFGYIFGNPAMLAEALRHPSATGRRGGSSFERLEFLGDRVLGLCVAELLYQSFPQAEEGMLTHRLVALVRAGTLAEIARSTELPQLLQLTGAPAGENMLADALEAALGAIYLDGGLAAVQPIISKLIGARLQQQPETLRDAKTRLQEWAQARGPHLPNYTLIAQSGPPHAPVFNIEVRTAEGLSAQGQGSSKRNAEQAAAATLLEILEKKS